MRNDASAKSLYQEFKDKYPICITRDIESAKEWIKEKTIGTQRYGLTASSGAKRLRKYGIWVDNKVKATNWFLNDKDDVRSSYFLEETATECDIQGLIIFVPRGDEGDWTMRPEYYDGIYEYLKEIGLEEL